MKNLCSLVLVIFLSCYTFAQPVLNGSASLTGSGIQIAKITSGQNTSYSYGSQAIGKETINGDIKVYRTYFDISLNSIPTNATIQQATVSYFNGSSGYTLKLTNIATIDPSNLQSSWTAVGSGSNLHQGLPYNGQNFVSNPIKSAIQNALANRRIIIGALSESENTEGSATGMGLSINVTYTYPAMQLTLQARNDLNGGNGGNIGVGIYPTSASSRTSPHQFTAYETQRINLAAYDNQNVGNDTWLFNDVEAPLNQSNWAKDKAGVITDLGTSSSITTPQLTTGDNGASFVAYLKKKCNTTFQNNFVGIGNGGNITVNGTSYSSPTSQFQVIAGNNITVTAQYQEINGIRYLFSHWDDNSTYYQKTFTINNNEQHTAYFIGKPSTSGRNLNFSNSVPGQPIVLSWSEHPNQNVTQYRIWRKIKNGPAGQIIGTVNRGTTNFIDYEYLYVGNGGDTQLQYDVQAYYSTEGTYSDPDWLLIGADEALLQKSLQDEGNAKKDIPLCYKIDNYPNPFNPSTTISYQIPSAGFVTLKVYDILGKEVADLVNENKPAGYYNVSFNAGNLPSGIYIYTIQTKGFAQSKKMLFLK